MAELSDRLHEYCSRIEYYKADEENIKKLEIREDVIYLNDYLYKYRVLIPLKLGKKAKTLVGYLTAAIIAYDKKLKSINYALRRYVTPLEDKYREHAEDPSFTIKRRFVKFLRLSISSILRLVSSKLKCASSGSRCSIKSIRIVFTCY